jgi:uncharacterized Ntn-hydrolase superfamily protein
MARASTNVRVLHSEDPITQQVREYKHLKAQIEALQKDQKKIRDSLMETIENAGYTDDQGHWWIDLPEDVDGTSAIKREKRSSRSLDEQAAEEVLTGLGLEECFKTVRVVDEDAVWAALYEEKINDADIEAIFPEKVTWALVVPKK